MGRFFKALKAGVASFKDADEPRRYSVAGKPVGCPHCGNDAFGVGKAMLNTYVRSLFNADWLDPSASFLVCSECGRLEWFAQEPERIGE